MQYSNKSVFARLDYYANKLPKDIVQATANEIKNNLEQEYELSGKNYYVDIEFVGNSANVIVAGRDVMFTEYGTGLVGKGTYPKRYLPTRTISFISAGNRESTQGWVYNYPNRRTKRPLNNPTGWYYSGTFISGQPAGKQIYNSVRKARAKLSQLVREQVKENLK